MNKGQAKAKLKYLKIANAKRCPICKEVRQLSIVETPQARNIDFSVLSTCTCSSILYTRYERGS